MLPGFLEGRRHLGDQFLERQQPVRQLHVARIDDLAPLLEGGRIFVVRVEEDDVGIRILLEDRAQDQRRRARLARAGRPEDGEVLAEQVEVTRSMVQDLVGRLLELAGLSDKEPE